MLLRIACARCRLASLWTDDPECFLATVCQGAGRCEATLVDEDFHGVKPSRTGGRQSSSAQSAGELAR